jgi:dual specificity tyrosine-phosphorylation-regulated kinase 2/3/4
MTGPVQRPTLPLPPGDALKAYRSELNAYEAKEILGYETVYYVGRGKTQARDWKYETREGDYLIRAGDQIAYRYEVLSTLGKGTYGVVARCRDHKTNEEVAIKVIKNRPLYHQQGLSEISILQILREKGRESFVSLKGSFLFRKHLCLVFELLMNSLKDMIVAMKREGVQMSITRRVGIELVNALKCLEDVGVVHCDLKPDNILLDKEGRMRLIDFGCACFEKSATPCYAQSRHYRAPEVILETGLSCSVDMWSLGCILAEMAKGKVLFPGDNEKQQLAFVMELLGKPPKGLVSHSTKRAQFFEPSGVPKQVHSSKGCPIFAGSISLNLYLSGCGKHFSNFISRCLDWNPQTRLTPSEAMEHPWLQVGDLPPSNTAATSRHRPTFSNIM